MIQNEIYLSYYPNRSTQKELDLIKNIVIVVMSSNNNVITECCDNGRYDEMTVERL